jgi:hypothetical protein
MRSVLEGARSIEPDRVFLDFPLSAVHIGQAAVNAAKYAPAA